MPLRGALFHQSIARPRISSVVDSVQSSGGNMRFKNCQTCLICGLLLLQLLQIIHYFAAYDRLQQCAETIRGLSKIVGNENPGMVMQMNPPLGPGDTGARYDDDGEEEASVGPIVYLVTPTYRRVTQMPDLTRLAQTLMNVDFVFWVVVEDGETTSPAIAAMLQRSGVPHQYFAAPTPQQYLARPGIGRGVFNRRAAITWLRVADKRGVLYFADDDNTYDISILRQIQHTSKVSVFPVGLVLQFGVSSPIVQHHKVVAFHDAYQAGRKFAMDMAGFAINMDLIHRHPAATIPMQVSTLEDGFLKSLNIELEDLEPLANGCTEVLVWHTRTQRAAVPSLRNVEPRYNTSNLAALYSHILP